MKKVIVLAAVFACAPLLSGCLVATAVGATVGAAGAVAGGAVDLVTTSKEEQMKKDNARLKKENEELKRQNKADGAKPASSIRVYSSHLQDRIG